MNLENELSEELTEEQIIEQLAVCNYGPSDIALYLGLDKKKFLQEWNDLDSDIREHYDRGRLRAQALVNQKLLDNAQTGNITAAQIYEKNRAVTEVENLKRKIYMIEE